MKCVVNFASGQQCKTELCLYFGVCVLQKFQQSGHRNGRFAFGGYSLRAGAFLLDVYKRQEEDSKANGRRVVKELGKLTP